jgi:transcriptional regulator with XRE-family HTH domain
MSGSIRKGSPSLPVQRSLRQLAGHVRTWRKLRGLTQSQLADRAGVGRMTIGRLERGGGAVSVDTLLRSLHALGVIELLDRALDPYESNLGRLRSEEQLPERVRPRKLGGGDG